MRPIKFRAWDETNGVMIDNYVNGVDSYGELNVAHFDIHGLTEFPKLTLMQFTGLRDVNGMEIYEGDIVRITFKGTEIRTDTVRYSDEQGAFIANSYPSGECFIGKKIADKRNVVEVIGNIYESEATQ